MAKKVNVNAVLEGAHHDEWHSFTYTGVEVDIPENVATVNIESYTFGLYGVTKDFKKVERVISNQEGAESNIKYSNSNAFGLRPRSMYLRDGRVFVEKNMQNQTEYMRDISDVSEFVGEILDESKAKPKTLVNLLLNSIGIKF